MKNDAENDRDGTHALDESNADRGMVGEGGERLPEPPARWRPEDVREQAESAPDALQSREAASKVIVGKTIFELRGEELREFHVTRRYIIASQAIAIVSLIIGGVLLSAIAIGCAVAACCKLGRIADAHAGEPEVQHALRKSGKIVIALAVGAFLLNAIALIFLYPIVADSMQSGLLGLTPGSPAPSGNAPGNTTWG